MIRLFLLPLLFIPALSSAQQADNNYVMGKTTGNLPYIEYGLGSDRLGGAKMALLDTGVVVKVTDSTIVNYRVQLSLNHFAYLPKTNFRKDAGIKMRPYYLTSSWLINGDSAYDYVTVTLDEKLPYRTIQMINPSRICVDIFGATSNTNWITHRSTAREVKNAYMEQIEDDVSRVIIELNHDQHWGYDLYYQGNKLVIRVRRQPAMLKLKYLTVAVDAGHGGDNPGARGTVSGIQEKNYTLLIARELEKALKAEGATVYMTRNGDESLGMTDRIQMLEAARPDFLISVHLNSSANDSVNGVSTYYRYIGFRPLSKYILESMLKTGLNEFGNVGNFNFALSGPTTYPNCLVEVAFLSNREDEKRIQNPQFHKDVAKQITEGIKKWLENCRKDNDGD